MLIINGKIFFERVFHGAIYIHSKHQQVLKRFVKT